MTNKERQAKLQYLLNSLSMTKEQKDIVVDLVNSSGNGGGDSGEKVSITIDINNQKVYFQNIEYICGITQETTELDSIFILNVANTELNKFLLDYSKGKNWIDFINVGTADDIMQCVVMCHWLDMNKRNPAFVICQGIAQQEHSASIIAEYNLTNYTEEQLLNMLDDKNIYIGNGSACSSKKSGNRILEAMGISQDYIEGNLRISFSKYNTESEVLLLCDAIMSVVSKYVKNAR